MSINHTCFKKYIHFSLFWCIFEFADALVKYVYCGFDKFSQNNQICVSGVWCDPLFKLLSYRGNSQALIKIHDH